MNNPDWWYDPPEEHFPRCECGHSQEDHNTPDDLDRTDLLDALQKIDDQINKVHPLETDKAIKPIRRILDESLTVCASCECRKFVEDNSDDYPE